MPHAATTTTDVVAAHPTPLVLQQQASNRPSISLGKAFSHLSEPLNASGKP